MGWYRRQSGTSCGRRLWVGRSCLRLKYAAPIIVQIALICSQIRETKRRDALEGRRRGNAKEPSKIWQWPQCRRCSHRSRKQKTARHLSLVIGTVFEWYGLLTVRNAGQRSSSRSSYRRQWTAALLFASRHTRGVPRTPLRRAGVAAVWATSGRKYTCLVTILFYGGFLDLPGRPCCRPSRTGGWLAPV